MKKFIQYKHAEPIITNYDNYEECAEFGENLILDEKVPELKYGFDKKIVEEFDDDASLNILINPYELITLDNLFNYYFANVFYSKFYKGDTQKYLKYEKKSNSILLNNKKLIPIPKFFDFSNDKRYMLYEVLDKFNLISEDFKKQHCMMLYTVGPFEIDENLVMSLSTDFIHAYEKVRHTKVKHVIKDKYTAIYTPLSGSDEYLKWKTIDQTKTQSFDFHHIILDIQNSVNINTIQAKIKDKQYLIIIRISNYFSDTDCLYEAGNIHKLLIDITTSMIMLENGGHLVLYLGSSFTNPIVEILYFIFCHFLEINIYNEILSNKLTWRTAYIFKGFKGIHKKQLDILMMLIDKLYKEDKHIGRTLNIEKQDLKYCKYRKFDNNYNKFISKIFSNEVPFFFKNLIKTHNKKLVDSINETNQNKLELKNILKNHPNFADQILENNIKLSIDWCQTNNIEINEIYQDKKNKLITNFEFMKYYFPDENIDFNKLQISLEGTYSVSKPKHAELTSQEIIKFIKEDPKNLSITDGTSNVGGNVINFAKYFGNVNAVELDKINYDILQNNVKVYERKNVRFYLGDITKIRIRQDILFLDPPWGGLMYASKENINLYLSKLSVGEFVKSIKDQTKYFVLKVPRNFDINLFYRESEIRDMCIVNLKKFYLLLIK